MVSSMYRRRTGRFRIVVSKYLFFVKKVSKKKKKRSIVRMEGSKI